MNARKIRLSKLKIFDDCEIAIRAIENDDVNYYRNLKHWYSGHVTIIKKGPEKKIATIQRKQNRFNVDE